MTGPLAAAAAVTHAARADLVALMLALALVAAAILFLAPPPRE